MGLRKNRPQVQVVSITDDRIDAGESRRKSTARDTHWDFLDEIEAPMWVDLIQESNLSCQDKDNGDDEWFNISHPFHHCSSLQPMSPKIPSSVSRSRGKDFQSRKWDRVNESVSIDLPPSVSSLKNRPSYTISSSDNVARDMRSSRSPLGIGGSQSDDSCEKSCVTETDFRHDQFVTTTESSCEGQHQESSDFSSRLPADSSRFLSLLKSNMRKSRVTRQASRVLVTERQSGGQNSSSSKSSVGSSFSNGCDSNKEITPGSRYLPGADLRKNPSAVNPKMRTRSAASSSVKQQNTQGKIQRQTVHAKVLVPCSSSNKLSSTAATVKGREKAKAASGGQILAAAKENFPRNVLSNTRMRPSGDFMQVQSVNGRKLPENSAKTKLASQKEKHGIGGGERSGTAAHQRAYHPR